MYDGPNIVPIAALIGDQARAAMLTALMSGEARTATELAAVANITKQTTSAHLSKLVDAGLVVVASQGRHKYFQLADDDIAQLLESLMGVAEKTGAVRFRPGPNDPELRAARVCYDHLAGELGVALYDSFSKKQWIKTSKQADDLKVELTTAGKKQLDEIGIVLAVKKNSRRPICRACLDWSVRRHHLAGVTGAALLNHCYEKKWAKRLDDSRVVQFTQRGESAFRKLFID